MTPELEARIREAAEQYDDSALGNAYLGFIQGARWMRDQALEEAAKVAEYGSKLCTCPGNRFDEGFSQGCFESAKAIRALKEGGK